MQLSRSLFRSDAPVGASSPTYPSIHAPGEISSSHHGPLDALARGAIKGTMAKSSLRADALNLPNLLTMARVALIPLVLWLLYDGTPEAGFWAAVVYIVAAVTDFLDGWLARRMGLVSILGKFLDPLADKLMVMSSLVFLAWMGRLPLWGAVIVILMEGRELAVTSLRVIAINEGVVMAAVRGGKEKTAVQMMAILMLIVY